jgi:hypothetical protein
MLKNIPQVETVLLEFLHHNVACYPYTTAPLRGNDQAESIRVSKAARADSINSRPNFPAYDLSSHSKNVKIWTENVEKINLLEEVEKLGTWNLA